jgi:phospholipase/carboxylesterase
MASSRRETAGAPNRDRPVQLLALDSQFRLYARMLDVFEVEPTQPQRGSVIWMHGLGATNHDFDDVIPKLDCGFLRFVFPAAPVKPVTINAGMPMPSWYDILSFDDPPLRESEPDVRESATAVSRLLQRELDRGIPSNRIVLAGFSQGGAMALHIGVRETRPLAGLLVLSGYMLLPHTFDTERSPSNTATPVFIGHGTQDPIVPLHLCHKAAATLRGAGYDVENHEYTMGHSLCLPEVEHIRLWLEATFQTPLPQ